MTAESSDPEGRLERDAAELDERLERVGEHIEESRGKLKAREEDAEEPLDDVGGDWEDTAPEYTGGADPTGFDDPEALSEEEEE
ncbi:MAG TPA: hypothetical protein VGW11_05780 [Solirubrobacteraceae bacterium]|nr:hypothetical protein [Solirubrobacteraceae bacterium]